MKKLNWFVIFCILAVPISAILPISRREAVWFSQYVSLLFLSFVGISLCVWRFNKYLSLFIAWCAISTFFVSGIQPRAVMCAVQVCLGVGTIYVVSLSNKQQRKNIVLSLVAITSLYSIFLVFQAWNIDPFFQSILVNGRDEVVGFSGSKDQLGTFFALTGIPLLSVMPVLSILTLTGLFISKSSFAFVAYIVGVLFYLYFKNKKYFFAVLCSSIIALATYIGVIDKVKVDDFKTRFGVWKSSIVSTVKGKIEYYPNLKIVYTAKGEYLSTTGQPILIKSNVFTGFGLGNFLRIFPSTKGDNFNYYDEKFLHAHNDTVEGFFELGLIGMAILIGWLISLLWRVFRTPMTQEKALYLGSLFVYFLNAQGNFLTHLAVSGFFLCVFIGLLEGTIREDGLSPKLG